mmetsp:Transcript_36387/g.74681  ORF Transcript_36387/g.74681 Transcript_36387/m.74681 type:complete len:201 (-) Transcript_36387:46-648(-)
MQRLARSSAMRAPGLVRQMSESARPQLYGLSGRYATALHNAATSAKATAAVSKDLNELSALLESTPVFKSYLNNPIISNQAKKEDILKIAKGANQVTLGFLQLLAENDRLNELPAMIVDFKKLENAGSGANTATVTSADKLGKKEQTAVRKALEKRADGKLDIEFVVDETIVGGMTVQVGDQFQDLSVRSATNKLARTLA